MKPYRMTARTKAVTAVADFSPHGLVAAHEELGIEDYRIHEGLS